MSNFALESPKYEPDPRLWAPRIECRYGRWQDTIGDIVVDAVVTDAPFDEATHIGAADVDTGGDGAERIGVGFEPWTADHVHEFVRSWSPRTRGWIAALTSDELILAWKAAFREAGRYAFQAVPVIVRGMGVRLLGDGPSSWGLYLMVGRPRTREAANWRTLPGGYTVSREDGAGGGRGKPLRLMRSIVGDYTNPGDVIADPLCGWGSTLIAARSMGRSCIGSEADRDAYLQCQQRIGKPVQMDLFT